MHTDFTHYFSSGNLAGSALCDVRAQYKASKLRKQCSRVHTFCSSSARSAAGLGGMRDMCMAEGSVEDEKGNQSPQRLRRGREKDEIVAICDENNNDWVVLNPTLQMARSGHLRLHAIIDLGALPVAVVYNTADVGFT